MKHFGQRRNAEQGYFNGSVAPFGYQRFETDIPARNGFKVKLIPQPAEAAIVREIFALAGLATTGRELGCKSIASDLNRRGIMMRGRAWTAQAVHRVLTNPVVVGRYESFKVIGATGERRPRDQWVTTSVPPIVEQADFERIQSLRSERRPDNPAAKAQQSPSLLSGLLKCGECGSGLLLMSGKTGKYHYYRCSKRQKVDSKSCSCPNLPKEETDRAVIDKVLSSVLSPERVVASLRSLRDYYKRSIEPQRKRLAYLQQELARETARVNSLYDQVSDRTVELDRSMQEYIKAAQRRIHGHQEEIRELEAKQHLPLRKVGEEHIFAVIEDLKARLADSEEGDAKALLKLVLTEVIVGGNGITLRCNKALLSETITKWKVGTPNGVPSFVSEWRARQDSNLLPPA